MPKSENKSLIISIYFALTLSTLLIFWQVRSFDFINYDDADYVSQNPHVVSGLTLTNITWAFTTPHVGNWLPLTWISLMLDCQLFGPDPGRIHLINLLMHITNTLLLFSILKKMTGAVWPSAFVAAAFAIHPMHVESVAWVTERKDVLSTLFFLLTLLAYVNYVRNRGVFGYLLTVLLFIFGLLTKSMLVTVPLILLLLDYWPLNRLEPVPAKHSGKSAVLNKRLVLYRIVIEKIPFFALAIISSIITFFVQRGSGAASSSLVPNGVANAFISYIRYIGKLSWPSNLAIFYPFPQYGVPLWQVIIAAVILLSITAAAIIFGRRQRYLIVGWLWFILTLLPVIGLIQSGEQAWADRYTYISYIGLFIIIAWAAASISKRQDFKIVFGAGAFVVLAVFGMYAHKQVSFWKDSSTLFTHAINVTQGNYLAYGSLGEYNYKHGNNALAVEYYKKAIDIRPDRAYLHNNLGLALEKQGKSEQAFTCFIKAVQLRQDFAEARNNLANALFKHGRFDEALEQFRMAISLKPDWYVPMSHLAELMATHPEIKGCDPNEAIRLAKRVCELTNYKDPVLIGNLASAYASTVRFSDAVNTGNIAVELDPNSAILHRNLGAVLLVQRNFSKAASHFKRSLEIEPNNIIAKNDLAWIFAAAPDSSLRNPSEAIRLAQETCSATRYSDPGMLDTLAGAYASAGQFSEAVTTAKSALNLINAAKQSQLKNDIELHLSYYTRGQPYIESAR